MTTTIVRHQITAGKSYTKQEELSPRSTLTKPETLQESENKQQLNSEISTDKMVNLTCFHTDEGAVTTTAIEHAEVERVFSRSNRATECYLDDMVCECKGVNKGDVKGEETSSIANIAGTGKKTSKSKSDEAHKTECCENVDKDSILNSSKVVGNEYTADKRDKWMTSISKNTDVNTVEGKHNYSLHQQCSTITNIEKGNGTVNMYIDDANYSSSIHVNNSDKEQNNSLYSDNEDLRKALDGILTEKTFTLSISKDETSDDELKIQHLPLVRETDEEPVVLTENTFLQEVCPNRYDFEERNMEQKAVFSSTSTGEKDVHEIVRHDQISTIEKEDEITKESLCSTITGNSKNVDVRKYSEQNKLSTDSGNEISVGSCQDRHGKTKCKQDIIKENRLTDSFVSFKIQYNGGDKIPLQSAYRMSVKDEIPTYVSCNRNKSISKKVENENLDVTSVTNEGIIIKQGFDNQAIPVSKIENVCEISLKNQSKMPTNSQAGQDSPTLTLTGTEKMIDESPMEKESQQAISRTPQKKFNSKRKRKHRNIRKNLFRDTFANYGIKTKGGGSTTKGKILSQAAGSMPMKDEIPTFKSCNRNNTVDKKMRHGNLDALSLSKADNQIGVTQDKQDPPASKNENISETELRNQSTVSTTSLTEEEITHPTSTMAVTGEKLDDSHSRQTIRKSRQNAEETISNQATILCKRTNKDFIQSSFKGQYTRDMCSDIIDKAWRMLVENMNPWLLLDEFRAIQYFQNSVQRDIEEVLSTTIANRQILTKVRAKGVDGYLQFTECLASSHQIEILHILSTYDDSLLVRVTTNQETNSSEKRLSMKITDLRHELITFYMSEHSTLPLSPLLEENDAALVKLYSQPTLLNIETGSVSDESCKQIDSYKNIFFENSYHCKNIYIVSDAGFGKTSFAKRLVMSWCQAHEPQSGYAQYFKAEDIESVKEFSFVFFISLRCYSGVKCEVESMIYDQTANHLPGSYTYQQLQDILRNERCLVILDGLDEWSHPVSTECTNFTEIPHRKVREKTTVLTTTRTWKLSLANLRTTDIDKRIEITGLCRSSSCNLIHNVTEHLNKMSSPPRSSEEFAALIKENNLEELARIPLIVMQLLCLWRDGEPIGKSRCEIYSSITELLLRKGEMKSPLYIQDDVESQDTCFCYRNRLSRKYQKHLLALGELSFNTLFGDERCSVVFDRSTAKKYLSEDQLRFSFNTGILSQWKVPCKLTRRQYNVSFLHKTYQEFFAALHIASQTKNPDKVKELIVNYCRSMKSLVEMSRVFVFLSGMNSELLIDVFHRVSPYLPIDDAVACYRAYVPYEVNVYNLRKSQKLVTDYQNLILECIGESTECQDKSSTFHLEDIIIGFSHDKSEESTDHIHWLRLSKAVKENLHCIKSVSIVYTSKTSKTTKTEDGVQTSSGCLDILSTESLPSLQKIQFHGRDPRSMFLPVKINSLIEHATESIRCLDIEGCSCNYEIAPLIRNMFCLESLRISNVKMDYRERKALIIFLSESHLQKLKQIVLQNISVYTNKASKYCLKLNLSKNCNLQCVSLRNIPISQLELPAEGQMTYLCLDQMPLKQLNLAPLKKLQKLLIASLHVKEVDVSQNVELESVFSNLKVTGLNEATTTLSPMP
ncbi:uncharacterized protein LOC128548527 [Mercenaria mercenaria]|uniref:uncharacterized protein LOC128548527 n=1 Tax=Mercenaria mercenaria TaxID=6596 RepID=UPI00234F6D82|nr:uncharacterized protein LOC128548527 [Mercenaria mercenaria]